MATNNKNNKQASLPTQKEMRKYFQYVFDQRSLDFSHHFNGLSDHALESYESLRGSGRPPVIMIHGIMKRSGTVYVGEMLSLHPSLFGYPNHIWEVPFLPLAGDIVNLQQKFITAYGQNVDRVGSNDFLPMFGGAFVHYLHKYVPDGRRMLLKMPGVQYLNNFYNVFPSENLLVLLRDGRDLVTSTIKTWPQIQFSVACRQWDKSAKMVIACQELYSKREGYWLAKYEDAVQEPEEFIRQACKYFGLDQEAYPFDKIQKLPVIGSSTTIGSGQTWTKKTREFKPIGRWTRWSAWKKSVFKLIAGKSLMNLDYCEDLKW